MLKYLEAISNFQLYLVIFLLQFKKVVKIYRFPVVVVVVVTMI